MIKRFIKFLLIFLYIFASVTLVTNAQESAKDQLAVSQQDSELLKRAIDTYNQNLFAIQSLDRAIAAIQAEKTKAEKDRDNALLIFQNSRLKLASEANVDLKLYDLEMGKDGLFRFIKKPDKKEDKK